MVPVQYKNMVNAADIRNLTVKPATLEDLASIHDRIKAHAWDAPVNGSRFNPRLAEDPTKIMMYRKEQDLRTALGELRVLRNGGSGSVGNAWLRYFLKDLDPERIAQNLRALTKHQRGYLPSKELSAFVVDEAYRGEVVYREFGNGRPAQYFVDRLVEESAREGVRTLFTLTRKPAVFMSLGFREITVPEHLAGKGYSSKMVIPQELLAECEKCVLQHNCSEIVMYIDIPSYHPRT